MADSPSPEPSAEAAPGPTNDPTAEPTVAPTVGPAGASSIPLGHKTFGSQHEEAGRHAGEQPRTPDLTIPLPVSQPEMTMATLLKAKVTKRQHSLQQQMLQSENLPEAAELPSKAELKNHVRDTIIQRVSQQGFNTDLLDVLTLSFCLPKKNASPGDWYVLLENPLFMSDADLTNMIELTLCGREDPPPPIGTTLYYIRSFSITMAELHNIMAEMTQNGSCYEKLDFWREKLVHCVEEDVITLRYCGMTTDAPWSRHMWDARFGRGSFMIDFLTAVDSVHPELIENANVFDVIDAAVPFRAEQEILNVREQALIALFGLPGLLNVEGGGSKIAYTPSAEDMVEFAKLQTKVAARYATATKPCPQRVQDGISRYVEDVQEFAINNPHTTNTVRYAFTNLVRDAFVRQAMPVVLKNDYQPILMIGSDVTQEDFRTAATFFESVRGSAQLISDMVSSMVACENEDPTAPVNPAITKKMAADSYLPFIDVYPFPKKDASILPDAMGFLRQYCGVGKPVVVVTFGQLPSSIALADFVHSNGIQNGDSDFHRHVGIPTLSRYYDENDDEEGNDKNACVVIPVFHPGSVVHHGKLRPLLVKLFVRQMWVVWLALSEVLLRSSTVDKVKLCEDVIEAVNSATGPGTAFMNETDKLLLQYNGVLKECRPVTSTQKRQKKKTRGSGVAERRNAAARKTGRLLILAVQYSQTTIARTTTTRIEQTLWPAHLDGNLLGMKPLWLEVNALWAMRIATVRTATSGTNKEAFLNWGARVKQHQGYYFAAANLEDQLRDIPNLLSTHLPSGSNSDTDIWEDDETIVGQASKNLEYWFDRVIMKKATSSKDALSRTSRAWSDLMLVKDRATHSALQKQLAQVPAENSWNFHENINGSEVQIRPSRAFANGSMHLAWAADDDTEWTIPNFQLPPGVLPSFAEDARYIHLVPTGVDIRDSEGVTLGLDQAGRVATVPIHSILLMLKDQDLRDAFVRLWEYHANVRLDDILSTHPTRATSALAPVNVGMVYPTSFFAGRQEHLPQGNTVRVIDRVMNNQLPLQPGDAMWLLERFFTEEYSDPDVVDCANPAVWTHSDSVWLKLIAFCQKPKYRNHPHRVGLQAFAVAAQAPKTGQMSIRTIESALKIFRPGAEKKRVREVLVRGQERAFKTTFKISGNTPLHIVVPTNEPESETPEEGQRIAQQHERHRRAVEEEFAAEDDDENALDDVLVGADGELMNTEMPEAEESSQGKGKAAAPRLPPTEDVPPPPPGKRLRRTGAILPGSQDLPPGRHWPGEGDDGDDDEAMQAALAASRAEATITGGASGGTFATASALGKRNRSDDDGEEGEEESSQEPVPATKKTRERRGGAGQ